ncbi:hypothetical protein J7400_08410 [Shimia sp. R9_2]|uniref:hypothetical protein n=1 Tax=Shimia sp. R9_2 TaxID=2821112 RepID=UPI001ADCB9CB|nr:hypothetical protein [Shimia sp. R9_2]MBO9396700.1 hypothetical protein [Shimia sp. R9_2]
MKLFFVIAWISVVGICSASAEVVDGANAADFERAKTMWLQGSDLDALQTLAELSRGGNVAAKILLSRIAQTPHLSGHVSEKLDRKERVSLFREPKGLSGRDWLKSASNESDLAAAMWAFQSSAASASNPVQYLEELIAHGEYKMALLYMKPLLFGEHGFSVAQLLVSHEADFGAAGRYVLGQFLVDTASKSAGSTEYSVQQADFAHGLSLQSNQNTLASIGSFPIGEAGITLPEDPQLRSEIADAVGALPEFEPLVNFCQQTCAPHDLQYCLASGAYAAPKGVLFPFPFASPAQSLVSDEEYIQSGRVMLDVGRILEIGQWSGCR